MQGRKRKLKQNKTKTKESTHSLSRPTEAGESSHNRTLKVRSGRGSKDLPSVFLSYVAQQSSQPLAGIKSGKHSLRWSITKKRLSLAAAVS